AFTKHAATDELRDGIGQGNVAASDRGRTRPAIRLQHIAVECDRALAERFQVDDGAQRTADQALNLEGTPALLAGCSFAAAARMRRARQHSVFRRDPTASGIAQELRNELFHGRGTQHTCVAELDQDRALSVPREVSCDLDVTQLVRRAATGSSLHVRLTSESDWMDPSALCVCRSMGQGSHVLTFSSVAEPSRDDRGRIVAEGRGRLHGPPAERLQPRTKMLALVAKERGDI